jgi:hypothetical protein
MSNEEDLAKELVAAQAENPEELIEIAEPDLRWIIERLLILRRTLRSICGLLLGKDGHLDDFIFLLVLFIHIYILTIK